jgi:hypothetical protein
VALGLVGGVHLKEYLDGYADIETIGALFLLNFFSATLIAFGLLLPIERSLAHWVGRAVAARWGGVAITALALGGVGVSAGSLVMLMIAERRPLFGFMEPGFHPEMILLARISEVATVLLLGAYLLAQPLIRRRRTAASTATDPSIEPQRSSQR